MSSRSGISSASARVSDISSMSVRKSGPSWTVSLAGDPLPVS